MISDLYRWLIIQVLGVAVALTLAMDYFDSKPLFSNLRQQWWMWGVVLAMCAGIILLSLWTLGEFRISARDGYVRHRRSTYELSQFDAARKVVIDAQDLDYDGMEETVRRPVIELRGAQQHSEVLFNWRTSRATFERLDEIVDRLNEAIAYQRSISPEDRA